MSNHEKQEISQKVCRLISKRPEYADILKRALTIEKNPPSDFEAKYGWEWDKVQAHPGSLTKLVAEGILTVGYKSNRYKHYQLKDREAVKEALEICARSK